MCRTCAEFGCGLRRRSSWMCAEAQGYGEYEVCAVSEVALLAA